MELTSIGKSLVFAFLEVQQIAKVFRLSANRELRRKSDWLRSRHRAGLIRS
jgi:hypothetical protein